MPESLFWCFLLTFPKIVRTPFFLIRTGRLLLVIAVSIVVKQVFATETANYDTKINQSISINLSQKCKLLKRVVQVKEKISEAVVRRPQIRCS